MLKEEPSTRKICYTVGEVADILGENASLVRFWSDKFPRFIKPSRNNKGNRLFTPADLDNFKRIHYYVKDRGMTLEGAERMMLDNKEGADNRVEIAGLLKGIREKLEEIQKQL